MIDFTKPLQTRNGVKVIQVVPAECREGYPLLATILWPSGEMEYCTYTVHGEYYRDHDDHPLDLVNVPDKSDEKPKFDYRKPVRTREGKTARIVSINGTNDFNQPIIALIMNENGREEAFTFCIDGAFLPFGAFGACAESPYDLINI